MADLNDALGRAGSYAGLRFSVDTSDPERGAAMQRFQEQATAISTRILFLELEWAEVDDARAAELLAVARARLLPLLPRVGPPLPAPPAHRARGEDPQREVRHRLLARGAACSTSSPRPSWSTSPTGRRASSRASSRLGSPDRSERRAAADAVTEGLAPGLRTRAFVFNTLMADKATDDRLRSLRLAGSPAATSPTRPATSRCRRSSTPSSAATTSRSAGTASRPRCSALERIADYDRMASVADVEEEFALVAGHRDRARRLRLVLRRAGRRGAHASSTRAGSTPRCARASAPARSAPTPCRAPTPTCS